MMINGNRKLEIGGEAHPYTGIEWEQFDLYPWDELKPYARLHIGDARNLSRFNDETFSEIYSSQTLEHFKRLEVHNVFREWFRVLKIDGTITVCLPDIVGIFNDYLNEENTFNEFIERIYGSQDYEGNAHYTGFTFDEFPRFLREAVGENAFIEDLELIAKGGGFKVVIKKIDV